MATTSASRTTGEDTDRNGAVGAVSRAASAAASTAGDIAAQMPEVASSTRSAVAEIRREMRAGSDEALTSGATLSFGIAIGLLLGGAPRALVGLAMVPAAAMAVTLWERRSGTGSRRSAS
jgi:hypothetical protein